MRQLPAAVEFRAPQPGDAAAVAADLRDADLAEIIAAGLDDVEGVIQEGIDHSALCWTATVNGRPVMVFGVREWDGCGAPWLLGTEELLRHKGAVIGQAPAYIDLMLQAFPVLINHVHAKNDKAVRWLKRVGFKLAAPEPHPVTGEPFQQFTMEA
jgi:hypothetical protein